ncbi:helix-turn-helix domain-containing protein [Gimesia aquarii]|uniref:Uncharacterized protein n=1 Tax=Gimesia aquarii TaxID=2527964 RepID=A0A517VYD2_9PLAN|nr:hypothetical protein [Gimesia aquarii]QDT98012.1 hypothetical protein V144x_34960 [Gimesia aquarii]
MTDQKEQGCLNFTRGNKIHILREIAPLLPHYRMTRVLRAVDAWQWKNARNENYFTFSYRQIAEFEGMSVPTVRRGIADLIKYDLLIKHEAVTSYGQQPNAYKIAWSILDAVVNDGEPLLLDLDEITGDETETPAPDLDQKSSQVLKVGGDQFDHPPDHDAPPESAQVVNVGGDHSDHPPDQFDQASLYPLININPPPSHKALVTITPERVVVEKELRLMGVGLASKAIETALGRGCSLDDVLQLIEYARSKPDAYGPGALKNRVCEALPGEDPSQGWPRESDEFLKQQRQAVAQKEGSQASRKTAEREAKRKANQRAQQELEREYGPQLDRLKRDELLDFVKAHCEPVIVRALAQNPDVHRSPGFYRVTLLEALRDQATGMPGEV